MLEVYVRPNAIQIAVNEGMTDLAVWTHRGCEPKSASWPANIGKTWDTLVSTLREAKGS